MTPVSLSWLGILAEPSAVEITANDVSLETTSTFSLVAFEQDSNISASTPFAISLLNPCKSSGISAAEIDPLSFFAWELEQLADFSVMLPFEPFTADVASKYGADCGPMQYDLKLDSVDPPELIKAAKVNLDTNTVDLSFEVSLAMNGFSASLGLAGNLVANPHLTKTEPISIKVYSLKCPA